MLRYSFEGVGIYMYVYIYCFLMLVEGAIPVVAFIGSG